MASVWFSVIVLISIQKVFGNVCWKNDLNGYTCDECIRCNGQWCNDQGSTHCEFKPKDGWCPNGREYLLVKEEEPDKKGKFIHPVYAERNLHIAQPDQIVIHYTAKSKQKPRMTIVNSTQGSIELKQYEPKCSGVTCGVSIEVTATRDFCNVTGGVTESVEVKVNVGLEEEAHIKYFVACACECSKKSVQSSPICNKHGNFSCGACRCDPGWNGEYCDQHTSTTDCVRGDIENTCASPDGTQCYGNGYCVCGTCICYTDRDGSQYFNSEDNCEGLCNKVATNCDDCLVNNTIGECMCKDNVITTMQRYNESLTRETDDYDVKLWVKCSETIDDCGQLEYFASRDETKERFVMMRNHCNASVKDAYVADTKVPIILGVLGVIAAVAAVSGIMLWKHMNTVPPVPLNDPQYENIDAEDCTGENPLYKPPTSSFKNPTYGKW